MLPACPCKRGRSPGRQQVQPSHTTAPSQWLGGTGMQACNWGAQPDPCRRAGRKLLAFSRQEFGERPDSVLRREWDALGWPSEAPLEGKTRCMKLPTSAQEEMLLLPSPSSLKGSPRAVMDLGTHLPPPRPLLLPRPCRAVSPVTGTQAGTDRAPLTLSLTRPDRALVTPVLSKTLVPLSPSPSPPHLLIAAASSAQLQPVLSRTALTLSS